MCVIATRYHSPGQAWVEHVWQRVDGTAEAGRSEERLEVAAVGGAEDEAVYDPGAHHTPAR